MDLLLHSSNVSESPDLSLGTSKSFGEMGKYLAM